MRGTRYAVVLMALSTGVFVSRGVAQVSPIGIIDFFGLRRTSERQAREALEIREGTSLPDSEIAVGQMLDAARRRIRALPGVNDVTTEMVCCDAGRTMLYIGVVEEGTPVMKFAPAPRGSARLPDDLVQAGRAYDKALSTAVRSGDVREDVSNGHALSSNAGLRAIEEQFIGFARRDEARLLEVLAQSGDARQRALAAQVLGYVADKKSVVAPLSRAVSDPDRIVRNNAIRALAVIAGYTAGNPQLGIEVAPDPFVDLLNSPVWTDRNKAAFALAELSTKRNPQLLAALRGRALASLIDMARWKSRGHAATAFFLLGRIAGLPEDAIEKAWERNDRDLVIAAANASKR